MPDVFISYAREDNGRAEQVARALEAAGLDVFWDSEIPPGQTWADYIESKLTNCKAVIVLWSEHSTRSQWVREEARMGRDKGKLIPVMLDASTAPFGFGEVQAANLSSWTGEPNHPDWARTLSAVQGAVTSPGSAPPPVAPSPRVTVQKTVQAAYTPPAAEPALSRRAWYLNPFVLVGGTIVAVIAVLGVIGASMQDNTAATTETTPVDAPAVQTAQAPQPGQRDVRVELQSKLGAVTGYMQQEGFQVVGEPYVSNLAANVTQDIPVTLNVGYEYRVVAVCDNDCADVDLWMYDQNNNEVASDVAVDAQPIVQVAPRWTGPFTLRVGMIQCTVAPCYIAAQLYGRAAQ